MASNKHLFDDVQGLNVNAIPVGGATSVAVTMDYADKIDSREDSVQGTSVVSCAGERVDVEIRTTDVMALVPLLASTPGELVCRGRESGTDTYGTIKAPKTGEGALVIHRASFSASERYASISVGGTVRFASGAKSIANVVNYTPNDLAPTITQPSRLWKLIGVSHTAIIDAAPDVLTVLHPVDLSFDVAGRLLTDYGDGDIGMTAVDLADFNAISGRLTVRDASATAGHQVAHALLRHPAGDLRVTLTGVGEIANKELTLRNVKFQTVERSGGSGYTAWTASFAAQWRDPVSPYTIRTLTGTAGDRMINFA